MKNPSRATCRRRAGSVTNHRRGRWRQGVVRLPGLRVAPDRYLGLPFALLLDERPPLVVALTAPGQPKLDLGAVALQVHPQRDDRQPLLQHLAGELRYLVLVQR